jgi:hypothetical protein
VILPDKLTVGVTLDHLVTLTAYPATDWTLTVYLRGPGQIDLTGAAEGVQHRLNAAASVTDDWTPGAYWYTSRVTDGTAVVEIESGQITIGADLAAIDEAFDGRSHVQRVLTAIEAVIEGRASKDQERYRINNRELQRTPIAELLRLRSQYQDELRRQTAAARGQSLLGRNVMVRF